MSTKPVKITRIVRKKKSVEQNEENRQPVEPRSSRQMTRKYALSFNDIFVDDRALRSTVLIGPADFDALEDIPDSDITPEQQISILRKRVNLLSRILRQVYTDNVTNPKQPIIVPPAN